MSRMSRRSRYYLEVTIYCDGEDCTEYTWIRSHNWYTMTEKLFERGWRKDYSGDSKRKDICPWCVRKKEREEAAD